MIHSLFRDPTDSAVVGLTWTGEEAHLRKWPRGTASRHLLITMNPKIEFAKWVICEFAN
jgi:hypothetical protein